MSRTAWIFVAVMISGCVHDPINGDTGDGGNTADGGGASDAGDCNGGCAAPQVCRFDTCIDPPPTCSTDDDCHDDSYCQNGECLPYGVGPRGPFDPSCKRLQVIGLFQPKAQCQWTGPAAGDFDAHKNVLSTPLVVDFDFDGDKAAKHPSIVFVTYNCDDGACGAQPECYGVIRVVDGNTCAPQYSIAGAGLIIGSVTPAVGDIDGDGRPDIVAQHQGGGVMGFKFDPAQNKFVEMWTNYSSFNATGCHWDSV